MTTMQDQSSLRRRSYAAAVHLAASFAIALVAAALVFGLWYPGPYRLLSGGRGLFVLVVTVDVVIGPLLTLVVFNTAKSRIHLRCDLLVIVLVQLVALAYGMHTVYRVRPVALVLEVDRFRVVSAADVYEPEIGQGRPEFRHLPLTGPWTLGVRPSRDDKERSEALFLGLDGYDVGQRPIFWRPYSESRQDAIARSRPVSQLAHRYPLRRAELDAILVDLKLSPQSARFLPLLARVDSVVLLDETGEIAGFAPFDGYF